MPDPSLICAVCCSLWQGGILNPLSEARDLTTSSQTLCQVLKLRSRDGNANNSILKLLLNSPQRIHHILLLGFPRATRPVNLDLSATKSNARGHSFTRALSDLRVFPQDTDSGGNPWLMKLKGQGPPRDSCSTHPPTSRTGVPVHRGCWRGEPPKTASSIHVTGSPGIVLICTITNNSVLPVPLLARGGVLFHRLLQGFFSEEGWLGQKASPNMLCCQRPEQEEHRAEAGGPCASPSSATS